MSAPDAASAVNAGRPRPRRRFPLVALFFLLPGALVYTVFMVFPLLDSTRLSFMSGLPGQETWAGLENFSWVISNPNDSSQFWPALYHTVVFTLVQMLVQIPVALLLAEFISRPSIRGRSIYRLLIFVPTTISIVIAAFIWNLLLSPLWGLPIGSGILGSQSLALVAISLISAWQFVGLPMILFYAVLIAIPPDLLDAAEVDGASQRQTFRHVKLPLLIPTIAMVAILTYISAFNAFELIFTLKGGAPGPAFSTDVLGTLFYREFFGYRFQPGDAGKGAAVGVMTLAFILIGVGSYVVVRRRMQTYEF
jgi:raffinose/stachyose/melibiose transport system permease protein